MWVKPAERIGMVGVGRVGVGGLGEEERGGVREKTKESKGERVIKNMKQDGRVEGEIKVREEVA